MSENYVIRSETNDDYDAIQALHYAAFGNNDSVPNLVNDLRQQREAFPIVSLVAEPSSGYPVGHVMLSHAWVDSEHRMIDVMVLSPLGVVPSVQGHGVGTALW
jgi:putative acetyltransferase